MADPHYLGLCYILILGEVAGVALKSGRITLVLQSEEKPRSPPWRQPHLSCMRSWCFAGQLALKIPLPSSVAASNCSFGQSAWVKQGVAAVWRQSATHCNLSLRQEAHMLLEIHMQVQCCSVHPPGVLAVGGTEDWLLQGKLQMVCCLTDKCTKLALLSPSETKRGWLLAGSMPDHKTKVYLAAACSLSSCMAVCICIASTVAIQEQVFCFRFDNAGSGEHCCEVLRVSVPAMLSAAAASRCLQLGRAVVSCRSC